MPPGCAWCKMVRFSLLIRRGYKIVNLVWSFKYHKITKSLFLKFKLEVYW